MSERVTQQESAGVARSLPMTGDEYLESLRDAREVYAYGKRVEDVTAHPAFRNSVRSVAGLYDALHDPAHQHVLTCPTDTGNGGFTHPFFRKSESERDLIASRDAIVHWQRMVYGWMGRSPDYKASFLATLGPNAEFYAPFEENARRWYRDAQERCLFFSHAIVHPPIDRARPADQTADVCVHVVDENDNGLVVSGAKVVATASAITNATFVAHAGLPLRKKAFGVCFAVQMSSPGLKLFSRASYEMAAAVIGSPFDYPLSSRFDENDAIMVFDKVLIPWENVFIYDAEKANAFLPASGFVPRFAFHGCARLAVKLDFICGLVLKAVRTTGTATVRGVQAQVGELLSWRNLFWGLSDAMAKSPHPWVGNAVQPNPDHGLAYRTFMGSAYARVKEIVQQTVGSGLIYLNSSTEDWKNPEIRPYLDQYVRGSNDVQAIDRVKLLKLLWDAVGTEFAGRHELYERNYSGDHEVIRLQALQHHESMGDTDRMMEFAEQCMSEYDLDGWVVPGLISNDDVSSVVGNR